MPTPITGKLQRLGIKKAIAWNTAAAIGAGDEVAMLKGQAKRTAAIKIDQSRGTPFSKDGTAGEIKVDAPYTFNLRYIGLDVAIAMFMGIAGAPVQQGVTTAYKNIYKWNPDIYGLFVTLAKLMGTGTYIEEAPTAKVSAITLSGQVGSDPLQLVVDFIGSNKEVASAVNTVATFANATLPAGADKNAVMFSHLVFRMNAQSGAALGAGDTIYPSKFTLSLKRNLEGKYTGQYRTTGSNPQDLIDEPTLTGNPDLKLTLDFPTHTSATLLTDLGGDVRKKMDITATGALIATPYSYQHLIQMPHLQMEDDNVTDDTGRISEPVNFILHGASAAPNGMTGITDPLWWTVINTRTTDPLA